MYKAHASDARGVCCVYGGECEKTAEILVHSR